MKIHLITMVGHSLTTLSPMLKHYRDLGIDSFWIYVRSDRPQTEFTARVASLTAYYNGVRIFPIVGNWITAQQQAFASISTHPDDWFVIADQDEFQLYPSNLAETLEGCDRAGFDHVNGCFIDRISADGSLPALDINRSIWDQYPIGAFLTQPVCVGAIRKVVAAKGSVKVTSGQHYATCGNPVPMSRLFIEVHHFKWVAGVVEYLKSRIMADNQPTSANSLVWLEGQRFLHYFASNGNKINLSESALMAARCNPHYPHWETITRICLLEEFTARMRFREKLQAPEFDIVAQSKGN